MTHRAGIVNLFLQPGEYFVGKARHRIHTLLGSCVSMTLWHPVAKCGAMSHFLLASRGGVTPSERDARYGEEALSLMCADLRRMGIDPVQCHAKVFGGGNMFPEQIGSNGLNIGRRNGEAAKALLRECGITIVSESLFGAGHRKIIFDVDSGDVWVRQLAPVASAFLDLGKKCA